MADHTMRAKLALRLDYLNPGVRGRVINDVLAALHVPTPRMVEDGATSIRAEGAAPAQSRAQWVFQAMIARAIEGG